VKARSRPRPRPRPRPRDWQGSKSREYVVLRLAGLVCSIIHCKGISARERERERGTYVVAGVKSVRPSGLSESLVARYSALGGWMTRLYGL
jgi:hypothetical protein